MAILNRAGVKIHYEVHGVGPTVFLSHGFSATSGMWRQAVAALSTEYQVITWDMRGHGQSDSPQDPAAYTEANTVADMLALFEHLEIKNAIVGGLSLGGYMSLAFYRDHPERVRSLLIIDTGPGFKKSTAREAWNRTALDRADQLEARGLAALEGRSPEVLAAQHRSAEGLAYAARGMLTQREDSVMQVLPSIRVPALVVVGADDAPFIPASNYMASKIPEAQLVVIEDAGHAVNLDQPERFNEVVLNYLTQLSRGKLEGLRNE